MKRPRFLLFWNADAGAGGGGGEGGGNPSLITEPPAGGGNPPPAGSGGGGGASTSFVGTDGAFVEGWTAKLPEDMKEAGASLGKFKSVTDLAKSYHHLEKTIGARPQGVIVPTDKSTPEEIAAYRKAMGVPEKLEEYNVTPEKLPDGMTWNPETAKPYMEIAHKHNIPPAAMKALVAVQMQQEQNRVDALTTLVQKRLADGKADLQKEWGADFEKNIGRAQIAAKLAAVDSNSPGFSDPNVVKAFVRLASMLSEDKLVSATNGSPGGGGGQARAKDIMTNPENPMYKKYQEGDKEAVSFVTNLLSQG